MKLLVVPAALVAVLALVNGARAATSESFGVHASFDITIAANGNITTTSTGFGPFDGEDDVGFDVFNNSSNPVRTLTLTAPFNNNIDAFDGDGIDQGIYGTIPDNSAVSGNFGYGGLGGNFFSNAQFVAGNTLININFAPSIAPGGTNFFSLEGPASITVTVTGTTPLPSAAVMCGAGILGLALLKKSA